MNDALFSLPSDQIAVTSDDCYTPRWVFDAMGLEFDLDVAAPPSGPWHVPCKRYYTAEDDGLAQPWDGLVWCNPPYSNYWPWAEKWSRHMAGVLMGIVLPETAWLPPIFAAADAVAFCAPEFSRPDGRNPVRLRQKVFVAFRGVGTARRTPRRRRPLRRGPLRKERRMTQLTVHAWGFYEEEHPRTPDGIAVSAETPHAAFVRIRGNIEHHGGTCTNTRITRTLDGWFIGAEWETPERPDKTAARMWHKVTQEGDSWPAPTERTSLGATS